MGAFIVSLLCVALAIAGSHLTAAGTFRLRANPGGGSIPANPGALTFGLILLALCSVGIVLLETGETVVTIQKAIPAFWLIVGGLGACAIGIGMAGYGSQEDNMFGELLAALVIVGGLTAAINGCMSVGFHAQTRETVLGLTEAAATGQISVQANAPGASAQATITPNPGATPPAATNPAPPPAANVATPPVANANPPPPAAPARPTITSQPARVSLVTWKASDPKTVTFTPLEPDREWAIVHDGNAPKGSIVHGTTYVSPDGTDLKNVRVYEVDITDPKNKKGISKETPVPLQ